MMFLANRYPVTIVLFVAVGALVACAAPAEEATLAPTVETPQSTVTASPTETPQAVETVTVTPVAEEAPLTGSSWILASFETEGEETLALPDTTVTLEFESASRAGGSSGCNSYGSSYEVDDNALSFGPIESTLVACEDEALMDQEQRFLAALESATEFEQGEDGNQLRIWYGDGESVLNLVTSAGTEEPTEPPTAVENVELGSIRIFGDGEGWAIGRLGESGSVQQILHTSDGGESWQNVTPDEAQISEAEGGPQIAASAYFGSPHVAWVSFARIQTDEEGQPAEEVEAPLVWLTADGGQSWQASSPLALGDLPFEYFAPSDLHSTDGQFGWLMAHLGAGMSHDYIAIFTTEDGGQSWERVSDPETDSEIQVCNKSSLVYTSAEKGWLAGDCPGLMPPLFLYHTTDNGETWTQTELPASEAMPQPANGGLGDRCGVPQLASPGPETLTLTLRCFEFEEETSQAWLYRTADNGDSWQAQALPEPAGTFYFRSADEGWYLAADESQLEEEDLNSRVYYTSDGGSSWATLAQVEGLGQAQIQFADAENGWIVVGYPPERALLRSGDGGEAWDILEPVVITR